MEVIDQGNSAQYKLTSTVMLGIETETDQSGRVNLGGSMTRQVFTFFYIFFLIIFFIFLVLFDFFFLLFFLFFLSFFLSFLSSLFHLFPLSSFSFSSFLPLPQPPSLIFHSLFNFLAPPFLLSSLFPSSNHPHPFKSLPPPPPKKKKSD